MPPKQINYQSIEFPPHSAVFIADALRIRRDQVKEQWEAMKAVVAADGPNTARCSLPPVFCDATKDIIEANLGAWASWWSELDHWYTKVLAIANSPFTIPLVP